MTAEEFDSKEDWWRYDYIEPTPFRHSKNGLVCHGLSQRCEDCDIFFEPHALRITEKYSCLEIKTAGVCPMCDTLAYSETVARPDGDILAVNADRRLEKIGEVVRVTKTRLFVWKLLYLLSCITKRFRL
jgi:hypothetical protein